MKLHYCGKYNGDENSLPKRNHPKGYVPFKEPEDMKKLSILANVGGIALMILLAIPVILLGKEYFKSNEFQIYMGFICPVLIFIPHEILHAIWFRKDVYLYTNFKQGLIFVIGTEDLSKMRFIVLSLFPNIIFGLIPYMIFLINPQFVGLGIFAVMCVGSGFGDYINVYNALRQMPKGSKTYISGMHSFWYIPEDKKD